ncbi:MAG: dTDP-4-amino-4,6-dideoxygalactose transaminase [Bacteroidetes bacterium]|nr:dTDP-4-amino-4,6-dideoxygalactose transaminase [Bacteroidota bacterium]
MIPFNKPTFLGTEPQFMMDAIYRGQLSGNGYYTKLCQEFFEKRYGFLKTLLTTSCTAALEMCAMLCDIHAGDEVIMPSYTFPSMANAFALRGAKIIFVDCNTNIPNIDSNLIEDAITPRTRAVVIVHYGGYACDLENILRITNKHNLFLIEDCAHSIDSFYKGKPLGSFGHFAAFSFHETKNITCGEGGMLVINDTNFINKAEIIWEKGTSRVAFKRGDIDKYNWVGLGSSYVLSELNAAYLYAQLLSLDEIQNNRIQSWNLYFELLQMPEFQHHLILPNFDDGITKNGNQFHLLISDENHLQKLIAYLMQSKILALTHYEPLHSSPFGKIETVSGDLFHTDYISKHLIRLPLYYNISTVTIREICKMISSYFK